MSDTKTSTIHTDGYVHCACGGCFDVVVAHPTGPTFCDGCDHAGCSADSECKVDDWGADSDTPTPNDARDDDQSYPTDSDSEDFRSDWGNGADSYDGERDEDEPGFDAGHDDEDSDDDDEDEDSDDEEDEYSDRDARRECMADRAYRRAEQGWYNG
jgi:hypothetical protein